jgi:carbon-monoxide dehydrogenase medium subunit
VKPPPFQYHRPESLDEALATLGELGDEAKVLAGGQSLVPMLNLRLARFEHLIDIGRVAELTTVERRNGDLVVGAGVRDRVLELDPAVAEAAPLLAAVTPYIGHFQIRNRGTIGGSLAHADPAAEYPATALTLDATFDLASAGGNRTVPASEFFTGFWSTALEADELLRSITFPAWTGTCGFGVAEFARRHGDFAIAGAVAAVQVDDAGAITKSALTAFGVGGTPVKVAAAGSLAGTPPADVDATELAERAVADLEDVTDDPQVPAAYRRRVAAAVIADAWRRAVDDVKGTQA